MSKNIFDEVNEFSKDQGYDVEPAYMANPSLQVVTPGINIMHEESNSPLFLSVDELRKMADLAHKSLEKLIIETKGN